MIEDEEAGVKLEEDLRVSDRGTTVTPRETTRLTLI